MKKRRGGDPKIEAKEIEKGLDYAILSDNNPITRICFYI